MQDFEKHASAHKMAHDSIKSAVNHYKKEAGSGGSRKQAASVLLDHAYDNAHEAHENLLRYGQGHDMKHHGEGKPHGSK